MNEVNTVGAQSGDTKEGGASLERLGQRVSERGHAAEPFLVAALRKIPETTGDKSKDVRDVALDTAKAVIDAMSPYAVEAVLPAWLEGLFAKAKPPQKVATLNLVTALAARAPLPSAMSS